LTREYLLREGLLADRIIKTGSPMYEVIHSKLDDIMASGIVDELSLEKGKYFVVSAHREENIGSDRTFDALVETLNAEEARGEAKATHPRAVRLKQHIQERLSRMCCFSCTK